MTIRFRSEVLTHEFLDECFIANFCEGTLVWKTRPQRHFKSEWSFKVWNKRFAGKPSGSRIKSRHKKNYGSVLTVRISGKGFAVSRILMAMSMRIDSDLFGLEVDHIDRNPENNSIINLRLASRVLNNVNRKFDGISCLTNGRWAMKFVVDNNEVVRGKFVCENLAKTIYRFLHTSLYTNQSPHYPFSTDMKFSSFAGLTPKVLCNIEKIGVHDSSFLEFIKDKVELNGERVVNVNNSPSGL